LNKVFALTDMKNIEENGFLINNIQIRRQLKSDDKLITLNIVKSNDTFTLDFNYHYDIKTLVEFKEKFEPENMLKFKKESIELLSNLYGLEIS
jgi:hypothetical protein